ncbi:MAG: AtuA-related protein [Ktedonobacterales bacterium]
MDPNATQPIPAPLSAHGDGPGVRTPGAGDEVPRRLYDIAYGREGDKGNIANVSVIARSSAAYAELKKKVTAARVKAHLGPLVRGRVDRYALDNIEALNFVLHDALDGGATRSLRLDGLGKTLAGAILYMPIDESEG